MWARELLMATAQRAFPWSRVPASIKVWGVGCMQSICMERAYGRHAAMQA